MNVNSISAVNFNGKTPNARTIKGALKNGETGFLEFSEKHCFAYSTRPDGSAGILGRYVGSPKMQAVDYVSCIQRLQALAKEGVDFLKEFMEAMSEK